MKDSGIPKCDSQGEGMRNRLGKRESLGAQRQRALGVAQLTQCHRAKHSAADAGVMAGIRVGQVVVAFALVACHALFRVLMRGAEFAGEAERTPAKMMRLDEPVMVAHAFSQCQNARHIIASRSHVAGDKVVLTPAAQRYEEPAVVIASFGKVSGTRKGGI